MTHFSDDIFLGNAPTGQGLSAALGNPSPMAKGVGPMGRVYLFDVVPLVLQAAAIVALQTTAGAANLTLQAGTGVTRSVGQDNVARYTLDTPRNVTLASTGNIAGVTFTVYGYDVYGQAMSEAITGPNNATVAGKKAFKSVTRISASGAVGTNTSVGYGDVLGLPVRVTNAGYIIHAGWAGALADDAGTFVAASVTNPSTTTTADVRGTFVPSSATDGARRLVMAIGVPALGSGPNATRLGALGIDQA